MFRKHDPLKGLLRRRYAPLADDQGWRIEHGDCIEVMRKMADASIDAIVTDPPYGIGFMGHEWDQPGVENRSAPRSAGSMEAGKYDRSASANRQFQLWCESWGREALRVLKPGGHAVAFGSPRTYHRLSSGLEDAGFEIRDSLMWLFGQGFPKSLNVSKAIDKAAGVERDIVGRNPNHRDAPEFEARWNAAVLSPHITAPATPEAEQWDGWGTALKPGYEPIVVARKPLTGTVVATVLAHGTGALNIDGCRVGSQARPIMVRTDTVVAARSMAGESTGATSNGEVTTLGRWPANVVLDEEAGAMLDELSGSRPSGSRPSGSFGAAGTGIYGGYGDRQTPAIGASTGGPSRFFYCAKASTAERNGGLDGFPKQRKAQLAGAQSEGTLDDVSARFSWEMANVHPTVKPINLMRWLVRLVTPPGGIVLDNFAGSGTTGCAAVLEGFRFVGIEREAEYVEICKARIAHVASQIPRED